MVDKELMRYDKTFHKYVLTIKGGSDICDMTRVYGSEEKALRTLQSISNTVYNYIYLHNASGNKPYVEYILAKDEEMQDVMFDVLRAQLEADVSSGYNDVKNQVGINFKTNTKIREEDIIERSVCPMAKALLEPYADKIMSHLFFRRIYNPMHQNRYEEFDY